MRNWKQMSAALAAAALGLGLAAFGGAARADAKPTTVNGVLIDNACGAKQLKAHPEDAEGSAAKHAKGCAVKCEGSGYAVITGNKMLKLDAKGNELAKEYLAKSDTTTKVSIEGTEADGTLAVTAINPQH